MDMNTSLLVAIQDAIPAGIIVTDLAGSRIIYVNDKSCGMFEYSRDELLMCSSGQLLDENEDPDIWKTENESIVIKFKTHSRRIVWGLMSSKQIRDSNGNHPGIFHSVLMCDQDSDEITGLGLESMKERAEYCRGTFRIESSPANGTRISVSIPTI